LALLDVTPICTWLPVTIGAVVVVGICAQGRALARMPALLSPRIRLAGLAAYVNRGLSHGHAFLGVLPSASARSVLSELTRHGWHDVSVLHALCLPTRALSS